MNGQTMTFHTDLGRKIGHCFKRTNEFRPTVRISAVVDSVHANKQIIGPD
jgi:hypothetical protein